MGAPVFISHHAIERLDRKGERSVDVEEIYEIIEKAVRQNGRDIAKLHHTDFILKGENGPPREPKNGLGLAIAKIEDSAGNPVYLIKTVHPRLLVDKSKPGFRVQGLKRRYSMYEEVEDNHKPRVYLDMDGVLADFFGEWSKLAGVEHYKDIDNAEEKLQLVRDHPTFWIDLPMLPHARDLVKTVVEKYGEYRVCSTPLNGDERSKPGKIAWLNKHFADMPPAEIVLTHNKAEHAQHDGVASILVDDFGSNINKWRAAGGIGIKYDDSAFPQVAKVLASIAKSGVVK
jgi:5'(3')-deoxyribonucleotidase